MGFGKAILLEIMDPMNSYNTMKSHVTPIPTPVSVRLSSSVLVGAAIASLTTDLAPAVKFSVTGVGLALALLIAFVHPYRGEMRMYRFQNNISPVPTIGQVMPLFFTWLALMLAPIISGAPLWATILVFLAATGWMYLTFPHVDGSRKLAFAEGPRRNT